MKRIVIENEKQAFDVLERALAHELGDQPYELAFKNWPILEIRLTGKGYDSTITSDMAEAVVDVQRAVNRAYARSVHGTTNSRSLTDLERRDIQFKAKVKRGSSLIEINFGEFAEKLATTIATKLTPEMLAITVIGLAVTGASLLAYKAYLQARTADKQIGQDSIDKISLSKEETRRLEVFAEAVKRAPMLAHARDDFDEARGEIIRSGANADTLRVNNVEIDGDTARVIGAPRRAESEEVQLNGTYMILGVDLRQPTEVRLRVKGQVDGREFYASFNDQSLRRGQIKLLQDAEWDRNTVYLSINARLLRGEVTVAKVVSVHPQPPTTTN
ncbi:hypothetical protein IFT68_03770 [Oxalobacteraceae sp. CFBP 13730]|nr:hypothetical protein [Oxalobacteraceae sp. CFBP 13730]